MSMRSEIHRGYWEVETTSGTTHLVPLDVVAPSLKAAKRAAPAEICGAGHWLYSHLSPFIGEPQSTISSAERVKDAYIGRLTMPGYLDSTDWVCGETAAEVLSALWSDGCPECYSEEIESSGRLDRWRCMACNHEESV